MKKRIQVLKHAELDRLPVMRKGHVLNDLATFQVDLRDHGTLGFPPFYAGFRSDFFTVMHVRSGWFVGRIDLHETRMEQGMMAVTGPYRLRQLVRASPDCSIEGVSFTTDLLRQVRQQKLADQMALFMSDHDPVFHMDEGDRALFTELVRRLEQRMERVDRHSHGMELLVNAFTDLLFELSDMERRYAVGTDRPIGRKEELVIRFGRLARAHYLEQRHLSFYSEQLFVTSKYLSETTKEIIGKTAGQVLDELLALEAKRLLEATELPIAAVADRLRFSGPAVFSKFFSRLHGRSPRAYRAAHGGSLLRS